MVSVLPLSLPYSIIEKAIAAEQDSNYIGITRERIQKFTDGKLPLRPFGKPIHKPTEKDRVAQIPLEWK